MKRERAAKRIFQAAYDAQQQRITDQARADAHAIDWSAEDAHMVQSVLPFYDETLAVAAQQGVGQLPVGVDWGRVNARVLALAQAEAQRFAQQATATSQAQVSQVIADWIAMGGTMDDLIDRVGRVWSGPRADVAAVTEVTRLYAQGNAAAWQASEVVQAMTWKTANDERVCPICGPLANTAVAFGGDLPPAHPHCRCWVVPVVKRPEE